METDVRYLRRSIPASWVLKWIIFIFVTVGAFWVTAGVAQAATLTVTSFSDDANPGTLRAAVMEANSTTGATTIIVPAGTYTLSSSLSITSNLTIIGAGGDSNGDPKSTIIQAGNSAGSGTDRIFNINPNLDKELNVTIQSVWLRYGKATDGYGGGAILADVGKNSGVTTMIQIDNAYISENSSTIGDGGGLNLTGGKSNGTLKVTRSTVTTNTSAGKGGGIYVQSWGPFKLDASTVEKNTATGDNGGGLYMEGTGSSAITSSTINENKANSNTSGYGGGIYANQALTLENSTIYGNTSALDGGGIYVNSIGTNLFRNNTLNANVSTSGNGGGIYVQSNVGNVELHNNIVAGNSKGGGTASDIEGYSVKVATSTNNLIGTGGAGGLSNISLGNQTGVANALLGPLANNGGITKTQALLPGSPALDKGDNANGPAGTSDQRGNGFARKVHAAGAGTSQIIDIGAFEANPTIQVISNQTMNSGDMLPITFDVGDVTLGTVTTTAVSGDKTLLPDAGLSISGTGASRTLKITPTPGEHGTTIVSITAVSSVTNQSVLLTFNLTVQASPDLTISMTHTGNFHQSQTGAQYTIRVQNNGNTNTSGAVVVTETPPPELTITEFDGTGWTCQISPTYTCTRNDSLAMGASYPSITLTGNVASNAGTSITNRVSVSGGGETNTTNNSFSDPTTVDTKTVTNTTASSTASPIVYGQTVQWTATTTSSSGTPTGTVTFKEGSTVVGSGTLDRSGHAVITATSLTVGTHTITAEYSGDSLYFGSTSATFTQVVSQATASVALTNNPSASVYGQSTTLTADVTAVAPGSGMPTGLVRFKEGTAVLGNGTLSSGSATLTTSMLAAGSHTITAEYVGDGNFATATSAGVTQVVSAASTTTTLSSSAATSFFGQSVTITADIALVAPGSGAPTGTVTFKEGSTVLGSETLSSGSASFTTTVLAIGSHTITAEYVGDVSNGNFASSTTAAGITQTVNAASTTTTLTSSAAISVSGQSVSITATVAAVAPGSGTPTGTVTFKEGATVLGTGTLSSGSAAFTTSTLAVGTHSISAEYAGDGNFANSTTAAGIMQTVNVASTTTTLSSSSSTAVVGHEVTFTATVTAVAPGSGTPTGTVTFKEGAATLGTSTLSAGIATFPFSALTVGSHTITAEYSGDGSFAISTTTAGITQIVSPTDTGTTLDSSSPTSEYGQSVSFTATVISQGGAIPVGSVTFKDGSTVLGTAVLNGTGIAVYSTTVLSVGSHTITAVYSGDSTNAASTSTGFAQLVKAKSMVSLSSSVSTSVYQQDVTLTATVTTTALGSGTPSGTVTFKAGSTVLGTGTLNSAIAMITTNVLTVGTHTITAEYTGDGTFTAGMTAAGITQTVNAASTTTTLTSSAAISVSGQSVSITATVAAVAPGSGTPTGTVTFKEGTTVLGTETLSSGSATFTTSVLTVGTHSISAEYTAEDGNFIKSMTTAGVTQTVNAASTTTTLLPSSVTSSVYGQQVTFEATVTAAAPGSGTPTGTVAFKEGSVVLGSGTMNAGIASFKTSALIIGLHNISAEYSGDGNFSGSIATAGISLTVAKADTTTTLPSSTINGSFGQPVLITATVAAAAPGSGTPSGTVTVKEGAVILGSGTLSSGNTTIAISTLAVGSHTVDVEYGGDSNYTASSASALTIEIGKYTTTTALSTSVTEQVYGQPVKLTATVQSTDPTGGIPNGTIAFKDGGHALGVAVRLDGNGVAVLETNELSVGVHAITAEFISGGAFTSSISNAHQVTVKYGTSTTVTAVTYGISAELSAIVTAPSDRSRVPDGTVTFTNTGTGIELGKATLQQGKAVLPLTLAPGVYKVQALYDGSTLFANSVSSNTVTLSVYGTGLLLDNVSYQLNVGDSHSTVVQVVYGAPPYKNVTNSAIYVSSHPDIASVDSKGKVTGLKSGDSQITVTYGGLPPVNVQVHVVELSSSPGPSGGASTPEPSIEQNWFTLDRTSQLKLNKVSVTVQMIGNVQVVILNENDLKKKLLLSSEPQLFAVELPSASQEIQVTLGIDLMNQINAANSANVIGLHTEGTEFLLPAKLFTIDAISRQLGISKDDAAKGSLNVQIVEKSAPTGSNPITKVIDINISVKIGNQTMDLNAYHGNYLEHSFLLSSEADLSQTVGVVIDKDGKIYPVPTLFQKAHDGKIIASLMADHHGTFTVITNKTSFNDISSSWASQSILKLGNRLIVTGYPDGSFHPNAPVTRAEFSAILGRALGIIPETILNATFKDVSQADWYAAFVQPMIQAGLISGYEDGTFRGNQQITREEAAILLSRTLKYIQTNLKSNQVDSSANNFTDSGQIADYAKEAVQTAKNNGFISGYEDGSFRPNGKTNRAETVMMIMNLLQHTGLMNP